MTAIVFGKGPKRLGGTAIAWAPDLPCYPVVLEENGNLPEPLLRSVGAS